MTDPRTLLATLKDSPLPRNTWGDLLASLPEKQQEVLIPFMEALARDEKPDLAAIGATLSPPIDRTSVKRRLDTAGRLLATRLQALTLI